MSDSLVAKQVEPAQTPVKIIGERRLKSVVVPTSRIKLLKRLQYKKSSSPKIVRKKQKSRAAKQPKPVVTPEQRRKETLQISSDSDEDILNVTEEIDIDSAASERGKLLRKSTLKPAVDKPVPIREPDPILPNCTDTTKRIVRIVQRQHTSASTLDVTVVPKTKSIGIQVGTPSPELNKRQVVPPIVLPAQEPPLKSYWTHRVNLPYPPAQAHEVQPMLNGQYLQQPQPYQYYQQPYVPFAQPQYIQAGPSNQPLIGHQFQPNRRQRRNFIKHQKYLQRNQRFN